MPKIVEHEQYRRELLERSFTVLAERGYANVTMRQLAEALGVSTGTLYHYFPSKQAIFEQLVTFITERDVSGLRARLKPQPTVEDMLRALVDHIEQNYGFYSKQLLLLLDYYRRFEPDEVRRDALARRQQQRYAELLVELLGERDPAVFKLLCCIFDGYLVQQMYMPHDVSSTAFAALLAEVMGGYLHRSQTDEREALLG
jgi:AcrR family transcriptional regulator